MNGNWLLHYPVWDLDFFGGGFFIALIATIHVYIAHFAVGGGLFIVLTETKGYRENRPGVVDYARMHGRFFLLLTMVMGALTGVGIWFTISVLNPAATSTLIHRFVFGWATEWVFFVAEIAALFVYYYTFGKMERRRHVTLGWLYFAFAWLSLFVVNGIIAYMLTPGDWLETRSFWDGFFNPSFWPSLFFRTFIALMFAGIFGFVTAAFLKDADLRQRMLRYCAGWLILPLPLLFASGWWYLLALPDAQTTMILSHSPEIMPFLKAFGWLSPILLIGGILLVFRVPQGMQKTIAILLAVTGLAYMGSFEWIREAGRRPYIIHGLTYANSLPADIGETTEQNGLLKSIRWTRHREITDDNRLAAGADLFRFMCSGCHSVNGPMNDILPLTDAFTRFGMAGYLGGIGKIDRYMPPFPGNAAERDALAAYIVESLHGKGTETAAGTGISPDAIEIPPFDPDVDDYILLAWSSRGMHFMTDCDARFSLSPPGNDLYAQLIRRGKLPEHVMDGVTISYTLEEGFHDPAAQTDFWKYAQPLTGRDLPPNMGPDGNGTIGDIAYDDGSMTYRARNIPTAPYDRGGRFKPYPLVTLEARDADAGNLLAMTKTTLPVSTEMGCRHCHGGDWRKDGRAGIADRTADNILAVHDRMNGTHLVQKAESGRPQACGSCHGAEGAAPRNLSAAVHGFHALYLTGDSADACGACHPLSPDTVTQGFRGIHRELYLDCVNCHGSMGEHAAGLLKHAAEAGDRNARKRMAMIDGVDGNAIPPRQPWVQEPDCLYCHVDFNPPETDRVPLEKRTSSMAELFRFRADNAGIMCAACHGSPHAVYPASNRYGSDSLQPIQYQGTPYPIAADKNCKVCHTVDMEYELHHPNSLRMFRNVQ